MESIILSFTELVNCVPYWMAVVLAVVLGVLDFCYADKVGYSSFCKVTFDYRMMSVSQKTVDNLQMTMQWLTIGALFLPMFMLVLYGYSSLFVLLWWLSFLVIAVLTQWILLIVGIVYFVCTKKFLQF